MGNLIRAIWTAMSEIFRQNNEEKIEHQRSEPCQHLLRHWIENNEIIVPWDLISVLCRECGAHFVGVFRGYYELGRNDKAEPYIFCKVCWMKSYHPKDIENRFCANCGRFY